MWRLLLRELSTARLVLHVAEGSPRERVLRELEIPADRVRFVGRLPHDQYLRLYHHIDIALDPVPCGGGTTTCDALWMGVPVVSLAGQTAVSRSGLSILSNAGLPQFVANTLAEYQSIALRAASTPKQLSELRRTMRPRLIASPLMNISLFVKDMEAAFQRMWAGE